MAPDQSRTGSGEFQRDGPGARPHERTDEFYYILGGQGRMTLDDSEIELHEGVVVYVPRGTKHRAWGDLKVLVVCIPRGVLHDVHEAEPTV